MLCGGASRRMGSDKALVELDGTAMAQRVADALFEAGAEAVMAVGGDAPRLKALGLEVVPDDRPGAGPLAATLTALRASPSPVTLVVACDLVQPAATAMCATVEALVADRNVLGAVPVSGGHRQWAHVAWRTRAAELLAATYDRGTRSLWRAARDLPLVEVVDIDPAALRDADTPDDLGR